MQSIVDTVGQRYTKAEEIERVWSDAFLMDISIPDRQQCFFSTHHCQLPGVGISSFSGSVSAMTRSHSQANQASQDLMLCVASQANVHVLRGGRERDYSPGQAHVWMADQPAHCAVDGDYSALMLSFPASSLAHFDLDRVLDRGVQAGGELQLLLHYAISTARLWSTLSRDASDRAVRHIVELAALVLAGGDLAPGAITDGSSIRAARLGRVKADIAKHLKNPCLSPEWIAGREGIGNRYLRDLLSDANTNFSQLVLNMRLEESYRLLTDIRYRHTTVSAIAFSVGFSDLSYFCRAFKRRYRITPTDARRQEQASAPYCR